MLGNTGSEQWNLGLSAQYRWDSGQARVGWHHYDFRGGVFYGVQNSTPAEFEAQLTAIDPSPPTCGPPPTAFAVPTKT